MLNLHLDRLYQQTSETVQIAINKIVNLNWVKIDEV